MAAVGRPDPSSESLPIPTRPCRYTGPSITNPEARYICTGGDLWDSRHFEEGFFGPIEGGPCPLCALDAWLAYLHAHLDEAAAESGTEPCHLLTHWLEHPSVLAHHPTQTWASAARQGLLWAPSAHQGTRTWPWVLRTSAHRASAIHAAIASAQPAP